MADETTLFKRVDYEVGNLLGFIDIGDIALPDIQRPFVWPATKVRDLLDSMYRGFPIGYLLFWSHPEGDGVTTRKIGHGATETSTANRLIVDGQQRLTSLYAVFRGKQVLNKSYEQTKIEIAFRPRDGRFEVADAPIRRDPEYIADISAFLGSGSSAFGLTGKFLKSLKQRRAVDEQEEERLSQSIERLLGLARYPLTALEIAGNVDEEKVADIFVRINSQGTPLGQADFILTLLSVFWEDGRKQLERFSRASRRPPAHAGAPSPYNHFIQPGPEQLIRVEVATGFHRGRLKSVYQVLRGKDPETDTYSPELREVQLKRLQSAQEQALNLTNWHQFLHCLVGAGFRSGELISSQNALLYSYALYLEGKRFHIPQNKVQRLFGRWYYAATITNRYVGSFESVVDQDMSRVKRAAGPEDFIGYLERTMAASLTNDFWTTSLPNLMETSSARSPVLFAFLAAQNRLNAPVLFSHQKMTEALDPSLKLKKKALDRHHLFPRAWLARHGITQIKDINQIANLTLLEWPENIDISDSAPSTYVPEMRKLFDPFSFQTMCELHALPEGWEELEYFEFLDRRRKLMATIVRRAYQSLLPVQIEEKESAGA